MKKKLIPALFTSVMASVLMISPVAVKSAQKEHFSTEASQVLAIVGNTAQKVDADRIPAELKVALNAINPSGGQMSPAQIDNAIAQLSYEERISLLNMVRYNLVMGAMQGNLVVDREFAHTLFDQVFKHLNHLCLTDEHPLTKFGNLAQCLCVGEKNGKVIPGVRKAARFVALVEEFFDKKSAKPLYLFCAEWMKLLEDDNGKPFVGVEKIYNFLDQNKTQTDVLNFVDSMQKTFGQDLQNPFEFFEAMLIRILGLNPEAPVAPYADMALPLMLDKSGKVKAEFTDIYTFVKSNRNTKKLIKFVQGLDKLRKKLANKNPDIVNEGQAYAGDLAKLKNHFLKKYPPESILSQVIGRRITANMRYLLKNPHLRG